MRTSFLNIITLGVRPLYKKQSRFHELIIEFRQKFANPARANIVQSDINEFYQRLNDFDFNFVLFENYYRKQIENLNRFQSNLEEEDLNLTFLRIALEENKWKPTKPLDVLMHHFKYEFKFTAKPFISLQKKQHRKQLESLGISGKKEAKFTKSQKWTRVPINKSNEGMK